MNARTTARDIAAILLIRSVAGIAIIPLGDFPLRRLGVGTDGAESICSLAPARRGENRPADPSLKRFAGDC